MGFLCSFVEMNVQQLMEIAVIGAIGNFYDKQNGVNGKKGREIRPE